MPIQQARLLQLTLAEIQDKLNRDWETLYHALKQSSDPAVVNVEMDGGGFEDK
jgi:F420-0:gamma-glutamyl ligase-like protein